MSEGAFRLAVEFIDSKSYHGTFYLNCWSTKFSCELPQWSNKIKMIICSHASHTNINTISYFFLHNVFSCKLNLCLLDWYMPGTAFVLLHNFSFSLPKYIYNFRLHSSILVPNTVCFFLQNDRVLLQLAHSISELIICLYVGNCRM